MAQGEAHRCSCAVRRPHDCSFFQTHGIEHSREIIGKTFKGEGLVALARAGAAQVVADEVMIALEFAYNWTPCTKIALCHVDERDRPRPVGPVSSGSQSTARYFDCERPSQCFLPFPEPTDR